jgi:hypothetical protein
MNCVSLETAILIENSNWNGQLKESEAVERTYVDGQ